MIPKPAATPAIPKVLVSYRNFVESGRTATAGRERRHAYLGRAGEVMATSCETRNREGMSIIIPCATKNGTRLTARSVSDTSDLGRACLEWTRSPSPNSSFANRFRGFRRSAFAEATAWQAVGLPGNGNFGLDEFLRTGMIRVSSPRLLRESCQSGPHSRVHFFRTIRSSLDPIVEPVFGVCSAS